jgi:hypothetical protein
LESSFSDDTFDRRNFLSTMITSVTMKSALFVSIQKRKLKKLFASNFFYVFILF